MCVCKKKKKSVRAWSVLVSYYIESEKESSGAGFGGRPGNKDSKMGDRISSKHARQKGGKNQE